MGCEDLSELEPVQELEMSVNFRTFSAGFRMSTNFHMDSRNRRTRDSHLELSLNSTTCHNINKV